MNGLLSHRINPFLSIALLLLMTLWVCYFYMRETSKIARGNYGFDYSEYLTIMSEKP